MIKIENTYVDKRQIVNAVFAARNPMNSWNKSDSFYKFNKEKLEDEWELGSADFELAKKLVKAGSDHSKFMRMIHVQVDITAPMYWISEHDTYKVSTTRNSCSFMHKGVSKPFEITDFSICDERVYEVLLPYKSKESVLIYPYETDEYRIYETENGRKYKVFKNGRLFRCEFDKLDSYKSGRIRHFDEKEVKPSLNPHGYFEVNIGGRCGEKWMLHRLIAHTWIDNPENLETVNHKNGCKGDNSIENLEWMSLEDNIKDGFKNGLYDNLKSLKHRYCTWKKGFVNIDPQTRLHIKSLRKKGVTYNELTDKYNLTKKQLQHITNSKECDDSELFYLCLMWENIIEALNKLRGEYLDTNDDAVFLAIRQLLPQGYNVKYTWSANYAVLRNIYHARKSHRLPEWREFCKWIETLPYSELITM